jgi:HEAT repeat protein
MGEKEQFPKDELVTPALEVKQLISALTGHKQDYPILVQLAKFAETNQDALLAIVDRMSKSYKSDDLEESEIRRKLPAYLTPCVPALSAILEAWTEALLSGAKPAYDPIYNEQAHGVVSILHEIGEPAAAAVPALIRAMHADQHDMGGPAARALGSIGSEEAIRELSRAWGSAWERHLEDSCMSALAKLRERTHSVLVRMVGENDPEARGGALIALDQAGYPEKHLAPLALRLLSDNSIFVIEAAIEVLEHFNDPTQAELALPKLREIYSDEEHYFDRTRAEAAVAIEKITRRNMR